MLAEFHFLRPGWFAALLPLALLLVWQLRQGAVGSAWQRVVDPQLLAWLSGSGDIARERRRWLTGLLALAGLLGITALAGPTWERQPQPVLKASQARVLVLDLSRSMLATDLKPSRLAQARFKLEDILERSREGQTGLVAYAGEAFVISPLTDDSNTIQALLPALAPNVMPVQGARADLGLQQAAELLRQAGENRGEILLISDGVNPDRVQPVATALRDEGMRISVLSVGTPEGAPIPLPQGGFMQDSSGNIVIPALDSRPLQALARTSGGRYAGLTVDATDLDYLIPERDPEAVVDERQADALDAEFSGDLWREQGPWLVLLLLPLSALAFRRGWLFSCCLLPSLLLPPNIAQAAWQDWFRNTAQQTRQALDTGEHDRAVELAGALDDQPLLRGEAHYRNGDFEAAAEAFAQAGGAQGAYNRGNALAQAGQVDQAIQAYEDALELEPDMADAQHNLDLLKQMQQQQQQEQQQGDDEQQEQQDQSQSSEQQNDQQQDGQQQDGQQQEQGQSEQQQSEQQSASQGEQQEAENANQQPEPGDEQEPSTEEQQAAQQQIEEQQSAEPGDEQQQQQAQATELSEEEAERQRAVEQWLRRIPDDPGALLRNKFRYQYQQRQQMRQGRDDPDEDDW